MYRRECRYAKRTHPNKSDKWRKQRYWGRLTLRLRSGLRLTRSAERSNLERQDNWVFGNKDSGNYLLKFSWFNIERHTLIKGKASPDDPSLKSYWVNREKEKTKILIPSYQKIAKNQGLICPNCGESLFNKEEIHKHHIIPKSIGGKDTYSNLQLVHLLCHQQIHLGNIAQ